MGRAKKGKKGGKEEEVDDEYDVESSTPVETAVNKGKEKKGKRKGKEEDEDKNEQAIDEEEMPTKKKGKEKKKVDDDLEDLTKELENVAIDKDDKKGKKEKKAKKEEKGKADDSDEEVKVSSKKPAGKKKGKDKVEIEESDDDIVVPSTKSRPKGGFALLAADDSDDAGEGSGDKKDDEVSEEEEEKPAKKGGKKGKGGAKGEDNEGDGGKGGKKGKKKKKEDDDDDDLEKLLAELAMEYSGGAKEEAKEGEENEPKVEKEEKEKKGKKGKAKEVKEVKETKEVAKEEKEAAEEGEGGEEVGTVKTAAQKKKEKKEREKQKKLALKKQEGAKKTGEGAQEAVEEKTETETKAVAPPAKAKAAVEKAPAEKAKGAKDVKEEAKETEKPAEDDGTEKKEGEKEEGDDKKKKKKKDAKEDDKKKGPGKKTIAAMQEALKKMKEEEERLAREEEERLRKLEEAEQARLEQIRLEQERKERKKKKEKERRERLKAEGKFLTPKQKADRARAQAMLEALKAQGVEVPETGATPEKRAPRPGTRIRPHKAAKGQAATQPAASQQTQNATTEEAKKSDDKVVEVQIVVKVEDEKKEKKEEAEDDDGVRDAWDEDTSEEEAEEEDKSKASSKGKDGEPDEEVVEEDSEEGDSESEDEDSEEDSSDEEESESEEEHKTDAERRREKALARIKKRREDAEKNRTVDVLRAAVICVLGHVDTGKTKILDKLRRTNVQDGEAGGITQQIGATNVPMDAIKEQAKVVKGFADFDMRIPGLLIIDTPGHESFSNLRSRGSSLCDMAVLVVDIMHGLEPQTLESIGLLKTRKTPFIVALNKIDRLYDWQTYTRRDIRDVLKSQAANTQLEFEQRTKEVIVQFAEQGLNAALFYENPDPRTYVSLVPTSAITGEGMGNLLALLVQNCQNMLAKRLTYSDELQATVLEVKAIPGLGTTIDAILVNGRLREGDTMILAGTDGPIVTQIRSLLMPQPMKELRVKNAYIEYKEIQAAQGVKIAAKDLEKSIAGLNLLVAQQPDEVEIMRDEVAKELNFVLNAIKLQERGVYVQASTLGSLEALLEFLRTSKIPYSGIRIGPVVKKDVMKVSAMLEHESQYATILAFDVKVERDAQELADSLGVKIFQADIIYHLFDKFMAYREELKQRKRDQFKHIAVFPCKLKVLPQFVFNSRDPIVVGVMVEAGVVKEGTPICVPSKEFVDLGVVTSIEVNHKTVETARKGQEVCIKIEPIPGEAPKMFGRHFDEKDLLISKISRQSIDACKDYFRDDLLKTDWQLMVELKKLFQIL